MKKTIINYLGIIFLALVFSLPLILPYLQSGFFPTHDGEWAVVRLSEMFREIKDLQFPARYSSYLNFQYGYPLFNFAYPLPYYLGLLPVFLKFGLVNSIKILFSLSVILSFLSMYLLSYSLWKNKLAGLVSAILYIYVPYRIVDLFVRGSIGESLSFILFPLIFLGILKIFDKNSNFGVFLTAISLALLIATHNIMTILFGLIILLLVVYYLFKKQFKFIFKLGIAVLMALSFSAFFWIPAIFEKGLILLSNIPIADRSLYFVKPIQLLLPKWGYGTPTDINAFGYQIGFFHIFLFLLAFIFSFKNYKKTKDAKFAFLLIIITLLISLLLFSQSAIIWSVVPLLSEINYPWTLLAVLIFLISLIAGYLMKFGKLIKITIAIAVLGAILMISPHAKPQYFVDRGDSFYLTNQATTTSSNELMPLWVKQLPLTSPTQKVEVIDAKVTNLISKSNAISFNLDLAKSQKVRVNSIYYPGWTFSSNGKNINIDFKNDLGVMELNLPQGKHSIEGSFNETPLRNTSNLISLLSIISVSGFLLFKKFKRI